MMLMMMTRAAALFALLTVPVVVGHGMLVHPTPRNARDASLQEFKDGAWPADTDGCDCANPAGGCVEHQFRRSGQSCLWFSQGCSINCEECTGTNGHSSVSLCNSTIKPTNNNPLTRTMNRDSVAMSANDTYMYNPWRSPGAAPVADPCGMAGGNKPGQGRGGEAKFHAVPWAQQGDLGSKVLKKGPATANYTAGSVVEMSWAIRYNHGGGYQYRLCPASEPLTEECFQKRPLKFVGDGKLRHVDGTETPFRPTYVTDGTTPAGSTWAMNPIPRITPGGGSGMPKWLSDACHASGNGNQGAKGTPFQGDKTELNYCRSFDPVCKENASQPWYKLPDPVSAPGKSPVRAGDVEGRCSGDWTSGLIVDQIAIPADLKPGAYVLGWYDTPFHIVFGATHTELCTAALGRKNHAWTKHAWTKDLGSYVCGFRRWDCEETTQVWASCADVVVA